jgi:hypothetical protein
MTENQAAAREYWKDGAEEIRDALRANKAVIKSGARAVAADKDITYGLESRIIDYPAIRIVPLARNDEDSSMDGDDSSSTRLETMRYRVYCFDHRPGDYDDNVDNIVQMADRTLAALEFNTTLDGFAHDITFGESTQGRFDIGNRRGFVFGSSLDVIVLKYVARP